MYNIMITIDFHICGIIDWESASIIPRQLCTLPSWVTGPDLKFVDRIRQSMMNTLQLELFCSHLYSLNSSLSFE